MIVLLLLSSAFLGVCNGAVWLPEYNSGENQEISVKLLGNNSSAGCSIILRQADPDNIDLTLRVTTMALLWQDANFETWLTIDDQVPEKMDNSNLHVQPSALGEIYKREYQLTISGLREGSHVMKIRVSGNYYDYGGSDYDYEGNVSFTVDNAAPIIGNVSIQNITYFKKDLELACTINEPFSWIAYSLDNQANVTIKTANTIDNRTNEIQQAKTNLTDLTEGSHSITIYVNDTAGNIGASQTITFTVDKPEPYSASIIIVAVVAGAVAVVLLITRRSQKRQH